MNKQFLKVFWLVLSLAALSGCAAKPEPLRVFWPPLPDTPRLEWHGAYYSEMDFPKSKHKALFDEVMGNTGFDYFGRPFGVVSNGKGLVYVSDAEQRVIKVFDFNAGKVGLFAGGRRFQEPYGLGLDSRGNLYVAEAGSQKVQVFSSDAKPLLFFGDGEIFQKPVHLALNEGLGRIYVSDGAGHKIAVFDFSGNHLFSFGQWGKGDGELYSPQGMAIDQENRLFVADQFNARIQVFDADGNFLYKFGERGNRQWNFEFPKDLAFDSDGNLHVTDVRKSAVISYRPDGTLLLFTGGKSSSSPVGFGMPMAIHIDDQDQIYIADSLNRRFVHWQYLSEEFLRNNPLDEKTVQQQLKLMQKYKEDSSKR